ncbi:MAG TPA: HigA family addiction module antitoxin [Sphingomicrobium sp.]|nr:HigA family addiction module antitoxin [Sphingomicrobium sp.]
MTHMVHLGGISSPPAPGQVLKEKLLDQMDLTQAEVARAIGISAPRLNMILTGRCQLSAEIALRIEHVFDISPQYWLRIRNEFELFEERRRIGRKLASLPQMSVRTERETSAWRVRECRAAA